MLRILLLSAALVGFVSNPTRAQVPWECACTQTSGVGYTSNSNIGWVSSTVTQQCQVVTVGSNTFCQMAGTVSYSYTPTGGFTLISAGWGAPPTTFSPTPNSSGSFYPSPSVLCTGTPLGAYIYINGSLGGSQIGIQAIFYYSCNPI